MVCFNCQGLGHKSFNCPERTEVDDEYNSDETDERVNPKTTADRSEHTIEHDQANTDLNRMDPPQNIQQKTSSMEHSRANTDKQQEPKTGKKTWQKEQKAATPTQRISGSRQNAEVSVTNQTNKTTENPQPPKRQMSSCDAEQFMTVKYKKKTLIPNLSRARNFKPGETKVTPRANPTGTLQK